MKKLLLLICILICITATTQHKKDTSKKRYFFVGYFYKNGYGNLLVTTEYGMLPKKNEILPWVKSSDSIIISSEFVIVGLYEFKNKEEVNMFHTHLNEKLNTQK